MIIRNTNPIARHLWQAKESCTVSSPAVAVKYIRTHIFNPFDEIEQEEMWVLLLNTRHAITHHGLISKGTLNSTPVSVRDLFREAIRNNAGMILLTHNHPSGNEEPSSEDIAITKQVYKAGQLLGISVEDHLVIGKVSYTSMREAYGPTFC